VYSILDDAGHGGTDPGAVANGLKEKDLTLLISLYQKERFIQHGINVETTREIDSTEPTLTNRMLMGRKCDLSISNHINAGGGTGFEIWKSIKSDNIWCSMIINEIKKLNITSRGIKTRLSTIYSGYDYFAMNNTQPAQGIIIEYGFIDSDDYLILINRWMEMAEAVVKATVEYLGIKYVEVNMAKLIDKHPDWFNLGVEALNDLASRGILSNPELHIEVLKNADENSQNWLNFVIDSRICKKLNIQK